MGYSKDIYDEALQKLERLRTKSELEAQKRREMMYQACPRLEEIECEMAESASAAVRAVFSSDSDSKTEINKLKDRNLALRDERKQILASAGLPEDYLKPKHVCDKCKDEGYIDGRICTCMKKLLRQISYDRLNSLSPLELSDFDTFSLDFYSDTLRNENGYTHREFMSKCLSYCRQYAKSFSRSSESLLFQGKPGLGKTHLSLAIAKEVIERGCGVVYISVPALISKLEANRFGRHTNDYDMNLMHSITECDLLIMDDLGTEFVTPYSTSEVFNLINTRLLTSRPTIISTNLTLTELQKTYNPRTISRIIGGLKRFNFVGMDIRQQKTNDGRIRKS